jgi:glutathione synthase
MTIVPMRLLYIMDPVDSILPDKDTTFAFFRAAERRGHHNLHSEIADLYLAGTELRTKARGVTVHDGPPFVSLGQTEDRSASDVDAILIRKDPPFDRQYLHATLMLEHARGKTLLINDPRGLREANEKLYALNFPEFVPRTLIAADRNRILDFVHAVGGKAVIKPLDGAGGSGVFLLALDDMNMRAILDTSTLEGRKLVVVQEYLPAVAAGDKRVLLLDGAPLGAILRIPQPGDLRSNIHVGGSVAPSDLTPSEARMIELVAPRLKADGLVFVGLDIIGERLTEVNVTSPTGIQQLGRFSGTQPEDRVIEWIERRVGTAKKLAQR